MNVEMYEVTAEEMAEIAWKETENYDELSPSRKALVFRTTNERILIGPRTSDDVFADDVKLKRVSVPTIAKETSTLLSSENFIYIYIINHQVDYVEFQQMLSDIVGGIKFDGLDVLNTNGKCSAVTSGVNDTAVGFINVGDNSQSAIYKYEQSISLPDNKFAGKDADSISDRMGYMANSASAEKTQAVMGRVVEDLQTRDLIQEDE